MADSGIAQHPKYYGKKVNSEMRLPGDTRLFRDIKVKEIPSWLMKRDMSPLGLWFGVKRFKYGFQSKYLLRRNAGGVFFAMCALGYGMATYVTVYPELRDEETTRKYH